MLGASSPLDSHIAFIVFHLKKLLIKDLQGMFAEIFEGQERE